MSVYDYVAENINGSVESLRKYAGDVLLIVNTASKCGFTPQYEGLQKLYETYHEQGFHVLGFPCNQFAKQEPLAESEIAEFCRLTYQVTFPMHKKIDVNGPHAHPLFQYLKSHARGALGTTVVKWNFTKFLVGRDGNVRKRYAPATKPEEIQSDIERALGQQS